MDASAVKWVAVLGHDKFPDDVTEFLYQVLVNPLDGTALGVVAPPIRQIFNNIGGPSPAYLEADDPVVVDTLAAIAAADALPVVP